MDKKQILVVSSVLSEPETYAGRHRIEGLAKAWADAGHDVHVLTPGPLLARQVSGCRYHTTGGFLLRSLASYPRAYWVRRRVVGKFLRSVCLPDQDAIWIPRAYAKAVAVIGRHGPFDVVFSSFSSGSSHLVGAMLAKRHRIPWIADYRDIWTDNVHHSRGRVPLYLQGGKQPPKLLWFLHAWIERRALRYASCITTIADPLATVLAGKESVPVHVVPNGYDDLQQASSSSQDLDTAEFSIAYTGKLNNSPDLKEVTLFFDALRDLLRERPSARESLRCRFWTGGGSATLRALVTRKGLDEVVQILPRCGFEEAVEAQRAAAVLLLMLPLDARRSEGVSSRKLFDYLAARRPVLGIVPRGSDAAAILEETGAGLVVGTREEAAAALIQWFARYQKEGRVRGEADEAAVSRYAFSALAPRVLDCLNGGRPGSASGEAITTPSG